MLDLPQSQTEGEAYLWLHASDADPVEVKGKKKIIKLCQPEGQEKE